VRLLGALSIIVAVHSPARALGSAQLIAVVDQVTAYVNGDTVKLQNPPRIVRGRTMLPLRDIARLLDLPLEANGSTIRVARLTVDVRAQRAWLNGTPQSDDQVSVVGGQVYVSAKLLADAVNGNLSFSEDGRTLTLTAIRARDDNPLAPQARFSTDKNVYAPGERIVYTEYAFDPDGADITARRWTGRQDAFFQPGEYTITLQVMNARGTWSAAFSRTVRVEGHAVDTPLTFALRYGELGDTFTDTNVLTYPSVAPQGLPAPHFPLLFSDSPEAPTQSGVLYADSISGRARLLAYHINSLGRPARLYVLARNADTKPVEVRSVRQGETAPTRIEGILGQVTLMEYFASRSEQQLVLMPGQLTAVYASPLLRHGTGVNLLQDIETSGRVELTFMMLEDGLPPTLDVLQQLPVLPSDGKHQRGTFPTAVRKLRVTLTQLPARLVIGDGNFDPVLQGVDALTNTPQQLRGNYGVLYDVEVTGASNTVVALSPRGGMYRGAMHLTDGPLQQTIKLPRVGTLTKPDQPALLWRSHSDRLDIDFVPASGSNLPISFVFYRLNAPGALLDVKNVKKTYQP